MDYRKRHLAPKTNKEHNLLDSILNKDLVKETDILNLIRKQL